MRGGDTSALRAFNERLIIGAIRQHGPLSKADIARATGLSAQAAATIVNGLIDEAVLVKQAKVKGRVGQPYTPLALNPDGAFALGLKIGRRSVEAVRVDFLGRVVAEVEHGYAAPLPATVMPLALQGLRHVLADCDAALRERIHGLGVAIPHALPAWSLELGLAPGALDGWLELDVAALVREQTGMAAGVYNDATAACAAELVVGPPIGDASLLYLYLGTFAGGGLVLEGRLFRGHHGNAGALGSMPMAARDDEGRPRQLIHEASVVVLEDRLRRAGCDPRAAFHELGDVAAAAVLDAWVADAATALARTMVAAASVVDIDAVIVDGVLPPPLLARVVAAVPPALAGFNTKGLAPFTVRAGTVGRRARVLGAALLPLNERFSPDPDVLLGGARERAAEMSADPPSAP